VKYSGWTAVGLWSSISSHTPIPRVPESRSGAVVVLERTMRYCEGHGKLAEEKVEIWDLSYHWAYLYQTMGSCLKFSE
jgi:hypothetical protein